MIRITSIRNAPTQNEVWAIVRSLKSSRANWTQVTELSLSWDLFKNYLNTKNAGQFSEQWFDEIYVPIFLKEMQSPLAVRRLTELVNKTNDITLFCYCPDEKFCHRSIIAGILQGLGAEVMTDSNKNYSFYYKQYKSLI